LDGEDSVLGGAGWEVGGVVGAREEEVDRCHFEGGAGDPDGSEVVMLCRKVRNLILMLKFE
jgi:hypothetical protein